MAQQHPGRPIPGPSDHPDEAWLRKQVHRNKWETEQWWTDPVLHGYQRCWIITDFNFRISEMVVNEVWKSTGMIRRAAVGDDLSLGARTMLVPKAKPPTTEKHTRPETDPAEEPDSCRARTA